MTERAGTDERGALPRGRRRGVVGWADVRGRRLGGWAFILNRITGLGVLFYLYLHLVVLSQLAVGASAWNALLNGFFLTPIALLMDVVLLAGLLIHGLNGVRVGLVGFGLVVSRQKAMAVAFAILAAIVLLIGSLRFLGDVGGK
jgi:succinate dehydrogenase / fumarate reductase cytochrome b subunit